jgi:hypothetical protein
MADDPAKPPLSDPMAQALAEDAAEAASRAAQAPAPVVAAEPMPVAVAEAVPAGETVDPVDTADDPAKKKRTSDDVLKSRLGAKTKEVATERAARLKAESDLAAMIAAQSKPDGTPAAASPDRTYTKAEVDAEARKIAETNSFNQRANDTYNAGKDKFGDWEPMIQTLRDMGFMSTELLEAAMESGAASDVLHHLGANIDEAERIAALSPVKMGVELGKLAGKLGAPKVARVSGAPEPVVPVNGSVTPVTDFVKLADGDNMAAWVEARKKAGDPWAQGRKRL